MSVGARLAGFLLVLLVMFGVGFGVGAAVGPFDVGRNLDAPRPAMEQRP